MSTVPKSLLYLTTFLVSVAASEPGPGYVRTAQDADGNIVNTKATPASLAAAAEMSCPKHFELRSLEDIDPQAVCADLSPSKFYFKKGDPTKYILMLQGGGECSNPQSCYKQLMQSKFRVSSKHLHQKLSASGIFDECHSSVGSFTAAYSHYCSLDNYLGDKDAEFTDLDAVDGSGPAKRSAKMAFRGSRQVAAMLRALTNEGMGSAPGHKLLLAGFDSGAKGAAIWLNEVQNYIQTKHPVEVVGLINSEPGMRDDELSVKERQLDLHGFHHLYGSECAENMGELSVLCASPKYKLKFTKPRYIVAAPLVDRMACQQAFGTKCEPAMLDTGAPDADKKRSWLVNRAAQTRNFMETHRSQSSCAVHYGFNCDEPALTLNSAFWTVKAHSAQHQADLSLDNVLAVTLGIKEDMGSEAICALSQPIVHMCEGINCGCPA
eukprot:gnl/TRDRNA2_/TRDRNA2_170585_c0_seq2.p1 gnl/TRDRNA2_/TRDRNA2_170585_c0~~gnl/TRDRNA2_/TRDRNA2_170585_c0_seq2.p1  ORF type:complete len:436 (-),score=96.82 gnl/TRDRNA2_/TRDRNA2_170585_c0_seq2:70-1377(-)